MSINEGNRLFLVVNGSAAFDIEFAFLPRRGLNSPSRVHSKKPYYNPLLSVSEKRVIVCRLFSLLYRMKITLYTNSV